jgi:hypothetical protein
VRPRRIQGDNIKMDHKYSVGVWTGFIWFRLVSSRGGGSCEHDNEPSSSIIGVQFFDKLGHYQLFKEDSAPEITKESQGTFPS